MRKFFYLITIFFLLSVPAAAQDYARDRFRFSAVYNRTDLPYVDREHDYTENVNGFTAEADYKLFGANGARFSLAYNFKQMYHVNVYPHYFDGMNVVDLHRNVQTHSAGAQFGYTVKHAVEPFGALFYGTRKIHTDAPRQTVRAFRLGVNIPFHKSSPFFIKAHADFEKSYGQLPMGFRNPETHTLSIGGGVRF